MVWRAPLAKLTLTLLAAYLLRNAQRIDFWANAQTTGEWVLETALALEEGIDFEAVVFAARLLDDYVAHAEEAIAPQFYKNLVRCA